MKVATIIEVLYGPASGYDEFRGVLDTMMAEVDDVEKGVICGIVDLKFREILAKVCGKGVELVPVKTAYLTSLQIAESDMRMNQIHRMAQETMGCKEFSEYFPRLWEELTDWLIKREVKLLPFHVNQFIHLYDRDA